MAIEVKGLDKLQSQLDKLATQSDEVVGPALMAGGEVLRDGVKAQIGARGLIDTGALLASVASERQGPRTVIVREGPLPYVFAQEFGLPNQPITARQRGFFWAKFAETGDGMWRALALSSTYTIPAKPHFRPGVKKSESKAVQAIADEAARTLGGMT